jgi:hypothetical protein
MPMMTTYLVDHLKPTPKPLVLAQTRPRPLIKSRQDGICALRLPSIGKHDPRARNEFISQAPSFNAGYDDIGDEL